MTVVRHGSAVEEGEVLGGAAQGLVEQHAHQGAGAGEVRSGGGEVEAHRALVLRRCRGAAGSRAVRARRNPIYKGRLVVAKWGRSVRYA